MPKRIQRDPTGRYRVRLLMSKSSTLVIALVLLAALFGQPSAANATSSCGVVDIDRVGWDRLVEVKETEDLDWWIELGGELLVCGSESALASISATHQLLSLYPDVDHREIRVSRGLHKSELASFDLEVIASGGGVAVVRLEDPDRLRLGIYTEDPVILGRGWLMPAVPNSVQVRQASNDQPRRRVLFESEVQGLVDMVDGNRWYADVVTLASYNRYTRNPGIDEARDWLVNQLEALPGLDVTTPSFTFGSTTAYNVVATLTGHTKPDDWYIIGGHYDSISEDPSMGAPGAEDNGSGCAGVLEMARIFTAYPPEATVLFICYSAEELGLRGSEDHVDDLFDSGDLTNVQTMLNLDMIGYTSDDDLDCLLETAPFADFLLDVFEDAALQFTSLRIVTDLSACCSDHKPYLNAGVPALLTIENDWFEYPYYHTVNDLPEHLTIAMGREILKMNVAAMAQLIGAPDPPIFSDAFESGNTGAWSETIP